MMRRWAARRNSPKRRATVAAHRRCSDVGRPAAGRRIALAAAAMLVLALCAAGKAAQPPSRAEVRAQAAALAALGKMLFADPRLSPSGALACTSCHDPLRAFGPPNALPVQMGGLDGRQPGRRAVPSVRYLQAVPPFTEHSFGSGDEGDDSIDNGPTGGLDWDGRVDSGHEQARVPLLTSYEMANGSPEGVADKALAAGYGPAFAAIYGQAILDDKGRLFAAILKAFEVYEQDWRTFYPYSSKYDAYLRGETTLSPAEARGLSLFERRDKGNCSSCHVSRPGADGTPPQLTDYGLIALGVPRNPAIPANADPGYFDLGLCGPLRTDFGDRAGYCGRFRTPTLRNVATRRTFFHNGVVHSLRDAVAFYATRDTDPARWYPTLPDGRPDRFDDLPPRYRANLDMAPPFGGVPGGRPALTDQEIDDIVAFLGTLTDGWQSGPAPTPPAHGE
jgi:cytochrome c peroxidase